jgi:alkylation response protein AidB-like acyl-CoA dehydrogenase
MTTRSLATRGGGWLLEQPETCFTPEDFDETTTEIAKTTRTFVEREVLPLLPRLEAGEHELNVPLLRRAGDLGLLAAEVPEAYEGLDLPKTLSTVIAEELAGGGSFAVSFGAHSSIGTLPLVYFGTDEQKARYLPRLASGEWIGAYALTETGSGSDALGARTRATLSADGRHYLLSGDKMWITNAGFADLFTVFAKVDGKRFTAFLVERDSPGLSFGEEEHKLGIKGSSTRQLHLADVPVPVENVLGEIGKGHRIAFNVLNVGRYKLGAGAVGGAKHALRLAAGYAQERHQFGRAIASFGLVRAKLAEMASRTFAAESAVYRTVGLIDEALAAEPTRAVLDAVEEYAVEASIVKVLGSEVLDFCVDESLQIHGGYGYSAEFPIERAYRDSRINRIFEGTNEINRLLIPGMLLRRATKGELPLVSAAERLQTELLEPSFDEPEDPEAASLEGQKKLALLVAGKAVQVYGEAIEEEQEVLGAIADVVIGTYASESALLRSRRTGHELQLAMARLALVSALDEAQLTAARVLPHLTDGDELRLLLSAARRLTRHEPVDVVSLHETIADAVLAAGGYPRSG